MTNSQLAISSNFILGSTKQYNLTDTTNYSAETYSEILGNFKVISPTGAQIHNNTNFGSPDITLSSSATTSNFALPLDANNKVLNGTYTFVYTSRLVDMLQTFLITSNNSAAKTFTIAGNQTSFIAAGANFECVDASTTSLTIVSTSYSSTTQLTTVTVGETLGSLTNLATFNFTLTTDYTQTFTQAFTYETPSVCLSVNIDNCCSSLEVTDITPYLSGASVTRLHTISYPLGMVTPIPDIESPLQTVTVTPIYTGTWVDVFTASISGSQGIITITDNVRGVKDFTVVSEQYDCQISACYEALTAKYNAQLTQAPSQAEVTAKYLLQATAIVMSYQLAKKCGDPNASTFLSQIQAITESCNCDCGCDSCADNTPALVVGCCSTAVSTNYQIVIQNLDTSIEVTQNTVGDVTTWTISVSQDWFDTTFLASLNASSITELSDVNTTSVPPVTGNVLIWNGTTWIAGTPQVSLLALTDVDPTPAPTNGQVVFWNAGTSKFEFKTISGASIATCSDVSLLGLSNKQILQYTTLGNVWTNVDNNLSLLTDVNIAGLANGDALKWNSGTSKWVVYTPATALTGLSDVVITTPAQSDVLMYDAGTSKFINQPKATFVTEGNGSFNVIFDNTAANYFPVGIRYDVLTGAVTIRGVAHNISGLGAVAQTRIFTISETSYHPSQEVPFLCTVGIGAGAPTVGGGFVQRVTGAVYISWYMDATTGARTAGFPDGDIDLGQIPTYYV